jgi:Trypsin-like peptidase domain
VNVTVDPWRVAQIAVDRAPGIEGARGSGYLIAPGRVLAAAHVVAGALVVRVRLDVGQDTEIDVQAEGWWADPGGNAGTDLAVITIPVAATAGRTVESARFGRVSDSTAVLSVDAFGFPLFKLRDDSADVSRRGVFRDFEQASGHAPVAANRRQGTLAVYLDDPPPGQPPRGEPSPWQGMSGGSVWAAGRIVGVVAEHHPSEGTGRLTARRIDRAYEGLPASDLGRLVELLGLPTAASGLPDVVPVEPYQLVRSAYMAQVRDIAPDPLIGRESELADWAEFCAGADPYRWWQAGPWAGKSALASWFVLHPPTGVDVVSFFITSRLIGQADSDAFLDAMIEQLQSLYPTSRRSPAVAGARVGSWWDLLASTAVEAEERGHRLVVVVDGLDEDEAGATPPRGRPSIASLLPRRPPPGVRFIVTSRPDPGLPDDLPPDHPLRTCHPHHLAGSSVAEDIRLRAKQELRDLFAGDQIAIDVIGYIAGSGGGLNRSDLSALTATPPHKLDHILRGVFGRSLYTRASADPRDPQANPATRVYLFAHETLRVTAEEQIGGEIAMYREQVHEWVERYADAGWPDATPGYAIRGYVRLLVATNDVTRLSAFARDPRRHAFLLDATGSDYAALTEIGSAQNLIIDQKVLDLKALVELAAYQSAILTRNSSIPPDLAIVWARLGRFDHAEALARTFTSPYRQSEVLTGLAIAAAEAEDLGRAHQLAADAEVLARTNTDPDRQSEVLTGLATAIAGAGDLDRAEALARTIPNPNRQAQALTDLATAIAGAGDLDRAEALARTIPNPNRQAQALTDLATAIAGAGDLDRAEALARTIPDPGWQARALAAQSTAIAQTGDLDHAQRLATAAEAIARTVTQPGWQARALTSVATAAAEAGDLDRAYRLSTDVELLAHTITDPGWQAEVLCELIVAIAQTGDLDRAEALIRTISKPVGTWVLTELATAAARTGALDRAEALARNNSDPEGHALTYVATAIARTGDLDRAEALARTITFPDWQAQALTSVATAIAQTGDVDRAEAFARTITDPGWQAQALTGLATAAVQARDLDRAHQLAADAEACARTVTDPFSQGMELSELAFAMALAGDLDRAEALARTITDRDFQGRALDGLVIDAARTGDLDRAEALARTITHPRWQAPALTKVATAAAQAGDLDRAHQLAADAEALARTITDAAYKAEAFADLAIAIARAGDLDRAEALARTITKSDDQDEMLARLATAAAQAGDLDRAEALARTITEPGRQARALTGLVTAAAQAGDLDRAHQLAADAEALARTITEPGRQARALTGLVTAAAQAGDLDRAHQLAADAEDLARTVTNPIARADVLINLVTAVARAKDLDRAEALARIITEPGRQARALTGLAAAAAEAGDLDRAARLLTKVLVMDTPGFRWIGTVSQFFPSAIGNSWDIIAGIYATPT